MAVDTAPSASLWEEPLRTPHGCPCTIIIFGASGDLSHRKLIPALYSLTAEGLLDPPCAVVGYARRPIESAVFRMNLRQAVGRHSRIPPEDSPWETFSKGISYVSGSYEDPEGYRRLAEHLEAVEREHQTCRNRLFYLAIPPGVFPVVLERLKDSGLITPQSTGEGWCRVVVEKPFGRDLPGATDLNQKLRTVFQEPQIYRMDHYLGKETVQNILVFRLGNGIFEPLWNHSYVDHVQITVAETLGVGGRGSYFDRAGTLRDMVQNHLLQLLCLTAMEPPVAFEADAVRDEKLKVLRAVRPMTTDEVAQNVARGQYGPGTMDRETVSGYREEDGVSADSATETFVALKLLVDNWRWAGVPFYLRCGKRLAKRATEIVIAFRRIPHVIFRTAHCAELEPNQLVLRIQPDEGIGLRFGTKAPGPGLRVDPVIMDFSYAEHYRHPPPYAYERLLLDCMRGDATLFARWDEVARAWEIADNIRAGWKASPGKPPDPYPAGGWGPAAAEALLEQEGRSWREP